MLAPCPSYCLRGTWGLIIVFKLHVQGSGLYITHVASLPACVNRRTHIDLLDLGWFSAM